MFSRNHDWTLMAAAVISGALPLAAQVLGTAPVEQSRSVTHPLSVVPKAHFSAALDARATVRLNGHVHPMARPEADAGPVEEGRPISHMVLCLKRDDEQQAALDAFSEAVVDPQSPLYHQWLTPEQFGEHFGFAQSDLDRIAGWLQGQGFQVDEVPAGRWMILFSGTAGQVQSAFHTRMRYFQSASGMHFANADEPQVPAALADKVLHIAGLHDFPAYSSARSARVNSLEARPDGLLSNGGHFMEPSDFATIYNLNPVYSSGVKGSGVGIAVISPCSQDLTPAGKFWNMEGTGSPSLYYWYYSGTPKPCSGNESNEALLDIEWSGAIAPQAQVMLVSSGSADPQLAAVTGVVNDRRASVITMSYGICADQSYYNTWIRLWQQAHVSGITGLVSSGDDGPHTCDAGSAIGINGYCHSPYVTCVGGTQFQADANNPGNYWSPAGRALGYIPESAWNEGSAATGGGYSFFQAKPSWQTGNGYSARGVPDIALTSAGGHDGYRVCLNTSQCYAGWVQTIGGTSAAAPSMAGIVALLIQKTGGVHGSINPTLYALAARTDLGVIFHDVTTGNNALTGEKGYGAGFGWDPVSGLGSIDAAALINHWPGAGGGTTQPKFNNQRVTTSAPPSSGCTVPASVSAFHTTDSKVYLYFEATVSTSDSISFNWLAPGGKTIDGGRWSSVAGNYCFTGANLPIANEPLGAWQVRVFNNGSQVFSVPFTINR